MNIKVKIAPVERWCEHMRERVTPKHAGDGLAALVEIIMDEPGFLRLTRVGSWWFIFDYETREGEWFRGTQTEAANRYYIVRKAKLPRSCPVNGEQNESRAAQS